MLNIRYIFKYIHFVCLPLYLCNYISLVKSSKEVNHLRLAFTTCKENDTMISSKYSPNQYSFSSLYQFLFSFCFVFFNSFYLPTFPTNTHTHARAHGYARAHTHTHTWKYHVRKQVIWECWINNKIRSIFVNPTVRLYFFHVK